MSGFTVEPKVVQPAVILAKARSEAALRGVADKLILPTKDIGTPYAKMRLGWVTTVNLDNWTCTAYVGDQGTPLPNLPIAANARPVQNGMGAFMQVGDEYTLTGMLMRDQVGGPSLGGADHRVRKPTDLIRNTTSTIAADPDLRFYAQAGRSYLVEIGVLVSQNSTNAAVDFKMGMSGPSGYSWSGGAAGLDVGATAEVSTGNWAAQIGAAGATLSFGVIPATAVTLVPHPTIIDFKLSVAMGVNSGYVSFAWAQNASSPTTDTSVRAGSWLKADVTAEITA